MKAEGEEMEEGKRRKKEIREGRRERRRARGAEEMGGGGQRLGLPASSRDKTSKILRSCVTSDLLWRRLGLIPFVDVFLSCFRLHGWRPDFFFFVVLFSVTVCCIMYTRVRY